MLNYQKNEAFPHKASDFVLKTFENEVLNSQSTLGDYGLGTEHPKWHLKLILSQPEVSEATSEVAQVVEVPVIQASESGISGGYYSHLEKENEELKEYVAKIKESLTAAAVYIRMRKLPFLSSLGRSKANARY